MSSRLILCILFILFLSACKKDEEDMPVLNTYTIDGQSYTAASCVISGYQYIWRDADPKGTQLTVGFFNTPAAGTYRLGADTSTSRSDMAKVTAHVEGIPYTSDLTHGKTIEVSLVSEKLRVLCPEIWLTRGVLGTSGWTLDSIKVSGYCSEEVR